MGEAEKSRGRPLRLCQAEIVGSREKPRIAMVEDE